MLLALEEEKISEGHTRPLLMLSDRPDEQLVLFKEIMAKKLTVREAESLSRRVATEKIRNKDKYLDPQIIENGKDVHGDGLVRAREDREEQRGRNGEDRFLLAG